MIINILGDIPDESSFLIKIDNIEKELCYNGQLLSFDLAEGEDHEINIMRKSNKPFNLVLDIIIFILTCILQGILNIFLLNTESNWTKDVDPFLVNFKGTLRIPKNKTITFRYLKSRYSEERKSWILPMLFLDDDVCDSDFIPSSIEFDYYLKKMIKRIVSMFCVLFGILCFLLVVSLHQNSLPITLFIATILSLVFFAMIYILKWQLRKRSQLKAKFCAFASSVDFLNCKK